jgi:hypothetical protein
MDAFYGECHEVCVLSLRDKVPFNIIAVLFTVVGHNCKEFFRDHNGRFRALPQCLRDFSVKDGPGLVDLEI